MGTIGVTMSLKIFHPPKAQYKSDGFAAAYERLPIEGGYILSQKPTHCIDVQTGRVYRLNGASDPSADVEIAENIGVTETIGELRSRLDSSYR